MKIFTQSGKGRKQCPGCSAFVAAVTITCQCGHVFHKSDRPVLSVDANEILTYTEGGRGRKQCSKCEVYIGARLAECVCGGNEFNSKKKATSDDVAIATTYEEGGRGRKQCSKCKKYIGNRCTTCQCGSTVFIKAVQAPSEPKEVVFYEAGGPGKKQCDGCQKFIAARYLKCPCGSTTFVKKNGNSVAEKEIITYTAGGIGRKQCTSCQQFVGNRVSTCACGFVFPEHIKTEKPAKAEQPAKKHYKDNPFWVPPSQYTLGMKTRIIAAAGHCPFKLAGLDEPTVESWARKILDYGIENNVEYTLSALKHWAFQVFSYHTPDGKLVKQTLEDLEPVLYRHISEFAVEEPNEQSAGTV